VRLTMQCLLSPDSILLKNVDAFARAVRFMGHSIHGKLPRCYIGRYNSGVK